MSFAESDDVTPECPEYSELREWIVRTVYDASIREVDDAHASRAKQSTAQRSRASKPRGKFDLSGGDVATMNGIVRKIFRNHSGERYKNLWGRLFGALESAGLRPLETRHRDTNRGLKILYTASGKKRQITFGRFQNIINDLKNEKTR